MAANDLTWEIAERLCREAYGTKTLHLPSHKVKLLLVLIDTEGEERREAQKRQEEAEEKARMDKILAERQRQEAERQSVRDSRADWASRSNKAKLEARRERRRRKRCKAS